jgi:hypothetical protein
VRAFLVAMLAGLPALLLGLRVFLGDRGARATARRVPTLAWGEFSVRYILRESGHLAHDALSVPLLVVFAFVTVVALYRKTAAVLVPAMAALASWIGIALLAPHARVQPYYILTVVPVAALAVALMDPAARRLSALVTAGAAWALIGSVAPALTRSGAMYSPAPDAYGPRFARAVLTRGPRHVVTLSHYDAIMMAYYLTRAANTGIDWRMSDELSRQFVLPGNLPRVTGLIFVHSITDDSMARWRAELQSYRAEEDLWVVERPRVAFPGVAPLLVDCVPVEQLDVARLLRCDRRPAR